MEQGAFIFDRGNQAYDIDKILLLHSHSSKVAPVRGLDLPLFDFFPLGSCLLACLILLVVDNILFGRNLELDGFFIIDSPTVGTSALLVCVLKTVEAELAYLVATRTRLEVLVREVEFFYAKWTMSDMISKGKPKLV